MTDSSTQPAPLTIVVLTEDTLADADVVKILALHDDPRLTYRVLVPADTERNMLVSFVDHLGLGNLREALSDVLRREPAATEAKSEAADQLAESLAAFTSAGATADGRIVEDDPLPALKAAVAAGWVREIVVVTYPHAVEDTFHRDWASRARDLLQVPVLHLYSGTSELG
ncbi:hypothetical protein [Pengzhenrongella sicca]|uniref:Universal stress protein n=1 Tax=Pengzhenrongella sicca TaxID=2819238 RepID=A0A8A4ZA59_9MICO|nr:hypothetical protein [Pengzhenrongella sicca]QTE28311.1 hypothetical protein J4E96_13080 [Pengzhenrongella sicca]